MSLLIFFMTSYVMGAVCMAFFTLLERKVLGYMQSRKGPAKVGLLGLVQPLSDVAKLLLKEKNLPSLSSPFIFLVGPVLGLFLSFSCFSLLPSILPAFISFLSVVALLCITAMNVYSVFLSGWSSNSKYALLGSVRGVAQSISYEVSMGVVLISSLNFSGALEIMKINLCPLLVVGFWLPMLLVWVVTSIAETGRAPLDLVEGESEIVSGLNIEYSSSEFAFIFMAEYLNIILMSCFTGVVFLGFLNPFGVAGVTLFFIFNFVWVRGSMPRVRYDKLMSMTWKCFLPSGLCFFPLSVFLS